MIEGSALKLPPASPLSPNHHVFSNIKDSSLCVVTITTQFPWGEGDDAAGRELVI